MKVFQIVLNVPYTLGALFLSLISLPTSFSISKRPFACVVGVKSFWWALGYTKKARAMAIGNVVLMGTRAEKGDLEHELVHVEQFMQFPLIYPFVYYREMHRAGYRNNKFEVEAYERAGNVYRGNEKLKE